MKRLGIKVIASILLCALLVGGVGLKSVNAASCPPHGVIVQRLGGSSGWSERHLVFAGEDADGTYLYKYCIISVRVDHIIGICQRCGETVQRYDHYKKIHQFCPTEEYNE